MTGAYSTTTPPSKSYQRHPLLPRPSDLSPLNTTAVFFPPLVSTLLGAQHITTTPPRKRLPRQPASPVSGALRKQRPAVLSPRTIRLILFDGPLLNKENPATYSSFESYMRGVQGRDHTDVYELKSVDRKVEGECEEMEYEEKWVGEVDEEDKENLPPRLSPCMAVSPHHSARSSPTPCRARILTVAEARTAKDAEDLAMTDQVAAATALLSLSSGGSSSSSPDRAAIRLATIAEEKEDEFVARMERLTAARTLSSLRNEGGGSRKRRRDDDEESDAPQAKRLTRVQIWLDSL